MSYGSHGASTTKNSMLGWIVDAGNAEDSIDLYSSTLRQRSRDLYESGGLARSGVNTLTTSVCGWGIMPKPKIDGDFLGLSDEAREETERNILREWRLWAENKMCDAERQQNFYDLQQLAFLSMLMSGDVFVLFGMKPNARTPYQTTIRLIEADRICNPDSSGNSESAETDSGGRIIDGVEIDQEGVVYNREHAVPKSWFNEDKTDTNYPMYTDLHHLFPTDRSVNSMRSNYPYGEVDKSLKPTKESDGGFSKFGICDPAIGYTSKSGKPRVFEPNDEYKGDLARVFFYMATAYESYKNGFGKERSPKNWTSDMFTSDVYPFFTEWALKMLLRWSQQDPVSEKEIKRNEGIYGFQENRNPFVDYPGLEQYIWGSATDVAFSYDNYSEPISTGIRELRREQAPADDAVYNLSGQRVSKPTKGLYLRRGKKYLVK